MKAAALALALTLAASATVRAESGIASVYDYGRLTADGERFDSNAMTAAHRTLRFGTLVRVCRARADSTRCITVRINDRGPFARGRIIDLTPAAARALGFSGLARVTVEPLPAYRPRRGDFGFF
jgi:peptidoglycan lytic transglycosylase